MRYEFSNSSDLDRVRWLLARAEARQLLRQEPQAAVQPPLHRFLRDAEHVGGLRLRHPLDAHQVEDLPLVQRQLVDLREYAAAGCLSKRRARSSSLQCLYWLARTNTGRTVRSSSALDAGLSSA